MAMPEKLYSKKKDAPSLGLVDAEGREITQNSYVHTYQGKKYLIIWENRSSREENAAVYSCPEEDGAYVLLEDEALARALQKEFWMSLALLGQNYHTDGPDWYYASLRPSFSGMGMGMDRLTAPAVSKENWYCPACGHRQTGGRFCGECGTKRPEPERG